MQLDQWRNVAARALVAAVVLACVPGFQVATATGNGTSERPLMRVPKVIGFKPRKADHVLRARTFKPHYTALTNACAGLPPGGHITAQSPVPGSFAPVHSVVQLQTSCH